MGEGMDKRHREPDRCRTLPEATLLQAGGAKRYAFLKPAWTGFRR
jgi:hypothetical protein